MFRHGETRTKLPDVRAGIAVPPVWMEGHDKNHWKPLIIYLQTENGVFLQYVHLLPALLLSACIERFKYI